MKTLIISLEFPPAVGGIATYVSEYAAHIPGQVVVYAPKMGKLPAEYDKKFSFIVKRHNPYWILWPRWLKLLMQVRRLVRQEQITNIHIFPVGYVAWLIKKVSGVRYTIFFHGTDLTFATRNKFKRALARLLCKDARQIVVNSDFLRHKLSVHLEGFENKTIVVHPCPADIFLEPLDQAHLSTRRSQLSLPGKKVIITVARLVDGKGYPHLLRLMPSILNGIPNAVWLIIGEGPKQKELVAVIQKNSLQNVVRFLGSVPLEELPYYYSLANVFVLLTHPDQFESQEESFGLSFLEAGACAIPVVAGESGGVQEAVKDKETGLIVNVNQPNQVLDAIIQLLQNPDYAKELGAAAKARVIREFRWDKQLTQLLLD